MLLEKDKTTKSKEEIHFKPVRPILKWNSDANLILVEYCLNGQAYTLQEVTNVNSAELKLVIVPKPLVINCWCFNFSFSFVISRLFWASDPESFYDGKLLLKGDKLKWQILPCHNFSVVLFYELSEK